jgi:hypothetical protein
VIFADAEHNTEGRDHAGPDLQAQRGESIERFTKFGWGFLKTEDEVAKRRQKQLPSPLRGGFLLKMFERASYHGGTADLVLSSVILGADHPLGSFPGDLPMDPLHVHDDILGRHAFIDLGELLQVCGRELSANLVVQRLELLVLLGFKRASPTVFFLPHSAPPFAF